MGVTAWVRGGLGFLIAAMLTLVPFAYYRYEYGRLKRLRDVVPGKLYRSGQMTAQGFADAIQRFHIRTVINLQDEYPDPEVDCGFFGAQSLPETELCKQWGVRYVYLPPELISRRRIPHERPSTINRFLAVMDDPNNYPILIHCRAGLHRTGVLTAVYRMEYEGWSAHRAIRELQNNGFGRIACSSANDYITQYLLTYKRGIRGQ